MAESEDDEYEEDYEDESFESFPGSNGPEAVTSDAAPGGSGASGGDEVVSLEEYMNRLEQQVAERDEDTNEIMSTITRGLDGLSPPSGHRNHNKASPGRQPSTGSSGKASCKHTEEDDGDYILKKFNVKMSPSKADNEDDFLVKYLRENVLKEKQQSKAAKPIPGAGALSIEEIIRLSEQEKTERGYAEDSSLQVVALKKKIVSLEDRIKRDAEIKTHLKSICSSLKTELLESRQKYDYLYEELQQSKRKGKVKKKNASGQKKDKLSEENQILRDAVAQLQNDGAALNEKVHSLVALNNELNLQLKQSLSRELDWRTAHQELSDRVLKQFNSQMKESSSYPHLHGHANHEHAEDLGYGHVQKARRRPGFKVDSQVRSESDSHIKRSKKRLPPLL